MNMIVDGVLDWMSNLLTTLTHIVSTLNCSVIADLYNLQIIVTHTLVSSVCY
jgi:hypothetical protein